MDLKQSPLPALQAPLWAALSGLPQWFRLHQLRIRGFQPKVPLEFTSGRFRVKTVTHWEELQQVLKLRHAIFHQEHHDRSLPLGIDIDDIDAVCDHLVIHDTDNEKLIGCYRLTASAFSRTFYAQHRFDLESFLKLPGDKIELGRACIDKEYRNGVTLNLLWRGIGQYLKATGAQFLFGSTSIRNPTAEGLAWIWHYLLQTGRVCADYPVRVKSSAVVPGLSAAIEALRSRSPVEIQQAAKGRLPPLFQSYLRGGAYVACAPAYDPFMGSADFLTVLPVSALGARLRRFQ